MISFKAALACINVVPSGKSTYILHAEATKDKENVLGLYVVVVKDTSLLPSTTNVPNIVVVVVNGTEPSKIVIVGQTLRLLKSGSQDTPEPKATLSRLSGTMVAQERLGVVSIPVSSRISWD